MLLLNSVRHTVIYNRMQEVHHLDSEEATGGILMLHKVRMEELLELL